MSLPHSSQPPPPSSSSPLSQPLNNPNDTHPSSSTTTTTGEEPQEIDNGADAPFSPSLDNNTTTETEVDDGSTATATATASSFSSSRSHPSMEDSNNNSSSRNNDDDDDDERVSPHAQTIQQQLPQPTQSPPPTQQRMGEYATTTTTKINTTNSTTTNNTSTKTTPSRSQLEIFHKLLQESQRLKREGNVRFTSRDFHGAEASYARALKLVESLCAYDVAANANNHDRAPVTAVATHDEEQKEQGGEQGMLNWGEEVHAVRLAVRSNLAFALHRLGRNQEAEEVCDVALLTIENEKKEEKKEEEEEEALILAKQMATDDTHTGMIVHHHHQQQQHQPGYTKLWYRRAQAREARGNYHGAEEDLMLCLNAMASSRRGVVGSRNKETKDTEAMLQRVRSKRVDAERDVAPKVQHTSPGGAADHGGPLPTDGNATTLHCRDETNPSSPDSIPAADAATTTTADQSKLLPSPLLPSPQQPLPSIDTNTNKPSIVPPIRPSPSIQSQTILTLLSQSKPLKGEAFFLIDYRWWTIWCLHVNLFLDNEYSRLVYELEKDDEHQHQHYNLQLEREQWTKRMEELDQQRRNILKSMPGDGARIPEQKRRSKKPGRRRGRGIAATTGSDDCSSSLSSSSLSSSSDEDDSFDDQEEGGQATAAAVIGNRRTESYGPAPGSIDNSSLILPSIDRLNSSALHSDDDGDVDDSDIDCATDLYISEWRHRQSASTSSHPTRPSSSSSSSLERDNDPSSSVQLRTHLVRGYHYEILSREAYAALRCWYGERTPGICRRVEERVTANGVRRICVRVYEDVPELGSSLIRWTDQGDDRTTEVRYCGACKSIRARSRCARCASVYYCDRGCQASHWPYHKATCKILARRSPEQRQQEELERRRRRPLSDVPLRYPSPLRDDPRWGKVGLHNLGNTCFLNSALQCLSHSAPLTRHFLTDRFRRDLNVSNPLGARGELANAYGSVVKDLWMGSASTDGVGTAPYRVVSPAALKRAVARFASRFAGMQQHDAQEFLAFLLDGLHEDLNRVVEPPYVEKADVAGDAALRVAGAEAWKGHQLRNRSLVMDTFYGQFKSTCVCPRCGEVSVSFDAFNQVSLEIPQPRERKRVVPVLLFRETEATDGEMVANVPSWYGIHVARNGSLGDIKRALSVLCGIPPNRIALCDLYEHGIYDFLSDDLPVSKLALDDVVGAYEVELYAKETLHTIVMHCEVVEGTTTDGTCVAERKLFGYPILMSFPVESTCDEIFDQVCRRESSLVVRGEEKEKVDHEERPSVSGDPFMQIRIVGDGRGIPRPVFKGDGKENDDASSLLPKSKQKLANFLGPDCCDSYLFLRTEWHRPSPTSPAPSFARPSYHPSFSSVDTTQSYPTVDDPRRSRATTLDRCFENFVRPEHLDEDNKWYCSKCKQHVRATKTMEIWRLPNVLVVHLKRFEYRHALRRDKLETFVDYPTDGFDVGRYCASSAEYRPDDEGGGGAAGTKEVTGNFDDTDIPAVYDLFAVTNHYGRMGFGHYTAVARRWNEHEIESEWSAFDDTNVSRISGGVVSSAAYILFYRRRVFS